MTFSLNNPVVADRFLRDCDKARVADFARPIVFPTIFLNLSRPRSGPLGFLVFVDGFEISLSSFLVGVFKLNFSDLSSFLDFDFPRLLPFLSFLENSSLLFCSLLELSVSTGNKLLDVFGQVLVMCFTISFFKRRLEDAPGWSRNCKRSIACLLGETSKDVVDDMGLWYKPEGGRFIACAVGRFA